MKTEEVIARLDWAGIGMQLDQEGYAILPRLLSETQVHALAALRDSKSIDRRVSLNSEDLGRGQLFYFSQPVPPLVADLRTCFYKHLAPVANRWNDVLDPTHRYPGALDAFLVQNRRAGQTFPQSNLSRLLEGDYAALHQRSDGEQVFPLQLVALLSAPGKDFTGGEFVMTEQRPRMQSRPMVLPLREGDMGIISVAQRPYRGTKGYYRVNLKHAISRVRSGERIGLELVLHDARQGLDA
jgi:hypothetical protein